VTPKFFFPPKVDDVSSISARRRPDSCLFQNRALGDRLQTQRLGHGHASVLSAFSRNSKPLPRKARDGR